MRGGGTFFTGPYKSVWKIRRFNIFCDTFDEKVLKKLRCQIVLFIMFVPNFPGAKFSVFTKLQPNCLFPYLGAKLSVCLLGAKLLDFTTSVPNRPGAQLSGAKLSNHP